MSRLTLQQETIFNSGERLIPGVTHSIEEEIRHRSSYRFFRKVIESDLAIDVAKNRPTTILDLGCGTGHGSKELAEIPGTKVTGLDISADSISYAKEIHSAINIDYAIAGMERLLVEMPVYDYIVSRHAIEHVPDGLDRCLLLKWSKRMMINVPYNEPPGNKFHLIDRITKESFSAFANAEFFYEDLKGLTYGDEIHPDINSIICISSGADLSAVSKQLQFPIAAWIPSELRVQGYQIIDLENRLENSLAQLDIRLAQMDAKLNEMRSLPTMRIERKIYRTIKSLFFK